jgi:acyl-CoA thioester hydrolase
VKITRIISKSRPVGRINNSVYYFYIDTVVNRYLIDNGLLEIGKSEVIGLAVESGCNFFSPVSFPDTLTAGLRVAKMGTSSVRYEVGLFRNDEKTAAAQGFFVHVYVDEKTRKSVPISDKMRKTLAEITI